MRLAFALFIVLHGLIHLMGFVKALAPDKVPQLQQPISKPLGAGWLVADLLFTLTAIALFVLPQAWWLLGGASVVLSQILICLAWRDARYGTLANAIILVGALLGALIHGPWSLRADYDRAVAKALTSLGQDALITAPEIDRLPVPLQRYLRLSHAEGQPRTANFEARFQGRIRGSAKNRWMPFAACQVETYREPTRLFYMDATMWGLPVQVLHIYRGSIATMRVKLLGLITLVDAKGPKLDRSETVTLFNDMCVLGPGALVDPSIQWQQLDAYRVRGAFVRGPHSITADLTFNKNGELVDFFSNDRAQASADGKVFIPLPWTTPLRDYQWFGSWWISTRGEAKWHPSEGAFTYGEFELLELWHNVKPKQTSAAKAGNPAV